MVDAVSSSSSQIEGKEREREREGGEGRRERIKPPNNKYVAQRFSPETLWGVRVVKYVQK